jgi:uncharacterized membrane protein YedE/YeeE
MDETIEYTDHFTRWCEMDFGESFLSPGGPEEVVKIVEGIHLTGKEVLDIGVGLAGPACFLVEDLGAIRVTGIDVEDPVLKRAAETVRSHGFTRLPLILHNLPPLHWAAAGAAIAAITLVLRFLLNRRLGLSSGFEDLCSLVLPLPYFRRGPLLATRPWRLPFIVGLLLGGVISAVLGGGWEPTWDLGRLDDQLAMGPVGKSIWMFVGGLFIGFGTRLAGGCTSGHGIFGMSNFEWPSLVATISFMLGGILVTQLLYRVVLS